MRNTFVAAGMLCLFISSCDKEKQNGEAAASAASVVPEPPPPPPPAPAPGPTSVDAVRYVPESCLARGFIDIDNMRKHPKVSAQLLRVLSSTLSRNAQTQEALKLMESTLASGGVRLPEDARGFAVCVQSAQEWISVITLDVKAVKASPLQLIQKTVNASGGPQFAPKGEGKRRYLASSDSPGVLSFVAPGVLAVASNVETLSTSSDKPGNAEAFGKELEDMLLAGHFSLGPDNQAKLYIEEDDNAIMATLDVALDKEQTAKALADRQKFITDLKKGLAAQLEEVEEKELKSLAAKVQEASISFDDNRVHATLKISEEDVAGLIGTLAEATPDRFVKTVDSKLP